MNRNVFGTVMVAMMCVSVSVMAQDNQRSTMDLPAPVVAVTPVVSPVGVPTTGDPSAPAPVVLPVEAPPTTTVVVDAPVVEVPQRVRGAAPSAKSEQYVPFKLGMLFDLSVPSGVALGIEARLPKVPWFKLGLAGTGLLGPGIRGNVLVDPFKFPVVPLLNFDLGHQFPFAVPGVKNSPDIDFTYADFQGGLGVGSRDGFRVMLLGGMSYLDGTAHNFSGLLGTSKGVTVGDPNFNGWLPNAKIGFNWLF